MEDITSLRGKYRFLSNWNEVKLHIMEHFVHLKFFVDRVLGCSLIATGNAQLIEGNTWNDKFWGVCDGEGENHLGKILMKVRDDLWRSRLGIIPT